MIAKRTWYQMRPASVAFCVKTGHSFKIINRKGTGMAPANPESRPTSDDHFPDKQLSTPNMSYSGVRAVQSEISVDILNDTS